MTHKKEFILSKQNAELIGSAGNLFSLFIHRMDCLVDFLKECSTAPCGNTLK